jgi:hypothetical protein
LPAEQIWCDGREPAHGYRLGRDARPIRYHLACRLGAGDVRQLDGCAASARVDVQPIHATGQHLHQSLPIARQRAWHIAETQYIRAAGFFEVNSLHGIWYRITYHSEMIPFWYYRDLRITRYPVVSIQEYNVTAFVFIGAARSMLI